jgi:hypothetical protein
MSEGPFVDTTRLGRRPWRRAEPSRVEGSPLEIDDRPSRVVLDASGALCAASNRMRSSAALSTPA